MAIQLDHLILAVNERDTSIAFYTHILGLNHEKEGDQGPFSMLRVTPSFVIQMAAWGTAGGEHLAFAMSRPEFDAAFARIKAAGIAYGDQFDTVGNMQGPGDGAASQGMGKALYFFDPNKHLLEIRHYETA
jgi:catechol 2,3-dioxygenase-like lactoylglutathione lyase family enzyme